MTALAQRITQTIHGEPWDEDSTVTGLALKRLGDPPYLERELDLVEWGLAYGLALGLEVGAEGTTTGDPVPAAPRADVAERVEPLAWEAFVASNGGIDPHRLAGEAEAEDRVPAFVVIPAPTTDQERDVIASLSSHLTEHHGLGLGDAKPGERWIVALAHRLDALAARVTPAMINQQWAMDEPVRLAGEAAGEARGAPPGQLGRPPGSDEAEAVQSAYDKALSGKGYDARLLAAERERFLAYCEPHIDAALVNAARVALDRADELLEAHYGTGTR